MKLVRFGPRGEERPGIWLENTPSPGQSRIVDVRAAAFDIEDFDARFFTRWGLERLRGLLREPNLKLVDPAGVRLGPPVGRPGQIICLGKNYADHAVEFDAEVPAAPIFFAKAVSALNGPFDPIALPPGAANCDGEVELAVVIGRTARRVSADRALEYVAGYAVLNDVTDRDAQRAGKQWYRAKSHDTFCPLGPFLVTADEVPDPGNLALQARVNGRVLQDSHTSRMIFPIPFLISQLSATITLQPTDILSTGTPAGIGSAHTPPILLRAGDVLETTITGLRTQGNRVE